MKTLEIPDPVTTIGDHVFRDCSKLTGIRMAPAITSIGKYAFAAGSMGPKVEAACAFVEDTGRIAAIGALADIDEIVAGEAGTIFGR